MPMAAFGYNGTVEELRHRPYGPRSLKYLLSALYRKNLQTSDPNHGGQGSCSLSSQQWEAIEMF